MHRTFVQRVQHPMTPPMTCAPDARQRYMHCCHAGVIWHSARSGHARARGGRTCKARGKNQVLKVLEVFDEADIKDGGGAAV